MEDRCLGCERSDVPLINVTDHPYSHDGKYCEGCNPYTRTEARYSGPAFPCTDCAKLQAEVSRLTKLVAELERDNEIKSLVIHGEEGLLIRLERLTVECEEWKKEVASQKVWIEDRHAVIDYLEKRLLSRGEEGARDMLEKILIGKINLTKGIAESMQLWRQQQARRGEGEK